MKFAKNPEPYSPDQETIDLVIRKCFHKADGKAAERIALVIGEKIRELKAMSA